MRNLMPNPNDIIEDETKDNVFLRVLRDIICTTTDKENEHGNQQDRYGRRNHE